MSIRPNHFSAAIPCGDRRQNSRHVTLLRAGILHVGQASELCLVRNISSEGLMARVFAPLNEGETVQVELKCGELIAGSIIWEKNETVGVRFDTPIDLDAAIAGRWVNESGVRSRQPRLKVNCPATLRCGSRFHRGRVSDISAAGAKMVLEKELTEEAAVTLSVSGLPPLAAVVRWVSGTAVGVSFNERLSLGDLAQWRQIHSAEVQNIRSARS